MSEKPQQIEITFEYRESSDYREVFADGAYGGINSKGTFFIDFFTETVKPADKEITVVSETGENVPIPEKDNFKRTVYRDKKVRLHMSQSNVETVAQWMLDKITEYKKLKTQKPESEA